VQGPLLAPVKVLQHRALRSNGQLIQQALVQWEGLTENEATWEDCLTLKENYPSLNFKQADKIPSIQFQPSQQDTVNSIFLKPKIYR
jgi:hypothetical protein